MNMRKFYLLFRDRKVNALRSQLSWSHYRELLSIKNFDEIIYYINLTITNSLGYRELSTRIKNNEYERLPIETKNKLSNSENFEIKNLVPNPIIVRNKNNIEIVKIMRNIGLFIKMSIIHNLMKKCGPGIYFPILIRILTGLSIIRGNYELFCLLQ